MIIGDEAGLPPATISPPQAADCAVRQVQAECDRVETLTGEMAFDDGPTDRDGDGPGKGMLLEVVRAEGRRSHRCPDAGPPGGTSRFQQPGDAGGGAMIPAVAQRNTCPLP